MAAQTPGAKASTFKRDMSNATSGVARDLGVEGATEKGMNKFLAGYAPKHQGVRWRRSDLHLHSPGVFSFKFPAGVDPERDQDAIVEQYVQQLVDQNIEIANSCGMP